MENKVKSPFFAKATKGRQKSKVKSFELKDLKSYPFIQDVVVYPLKVNQDERGILVEVLKRNWQEVFSSERPFAQGYFSETQPGTARDKDRWHYHPTKQEDRFVVIKGEIALVLYDWRKNPKTYGRLNLFKMTGKEPYLLLIPRNVLHCFKVVSETPAILLNFPTTLYDKEEEGRVAFKEVKFSDGSCFDWSLIHNS